jgi:archaemetzincin
MIRRAMALTALCGAAGYAVLRASARTSPLQPGVPAFIIPSEMHAPAPAAGVIDLVPVGDVAPARISFTKSVIEEIYGARCRVHRPLPVPGEAWHKQRNQIDADAMLGVLVDEFPEDSSRLLAVTQVDMFAAGRPYVFGYGHLRDRVAIVSTARLDEKWYGRRSLEGRLRTRLYKAAVHELGHTAGNPHCNAQSCLMREVADLDALDGLPLSYCASCMAKMWGELRVSPSAPESQFSLGAALLRRRRYERAVAALERAAGGDPENAIYQNDLGVALLRRGEKRAAMRAFQRARRLRPDLPEPVYNLHLVERAMVGKWENQEEAAETATGTGPGPSRTR